MIRSSMVDLIAFVRELTSLDDDCTWSDERIQRALDARRVRVNSETMPTEIETIAGEAGYRHFWGYEFMESIEINDPSSVVVETTEADMFSGLYVVEARVDAGLTISGWRHDPYGAAADLLSEYMTKNAGQFSSISSGKHSISMGRVHETYTTAIDDLRSRSWSRPDTSGYFTMSLYRDDWPR